MTPEQARSAARTAAGELLSASIGTAALGTRHLRKLILKGFHAAALEAVPALVAAAQRPLPLGGAAIELLESLLVKHEDGAAGLDEAADVIVDAGALGPLVCALGGDAAGPAAAVLAMVASSHSRWLGDPGMRRRTAAVVAAGAAPALVAALRRRGASQRHGQREAAAAALGNIAVVGGDALVAAGAITALCAAAPAPGAPLLLHVVTCMANIAQDACRGGDFGDDPGLEARRDALCDGACLKLLVAAAGSGDAHIAGNALRCLGYLVQRGSRDAEPEPASVADATDARRGDALVAAGAEKAFVAALSSKALPLGRGLLPPACITARSLMLLAFCGSHGAEAAIVSAGVFKALSSCLKRKEDAVVEAAARACRYFAALGGPATRTALLEVAGAALSATAAANRGDKVAAVLAGRALAVARGGCAEDVGPGGGPGFVIRKFEHVMPRATGAAPPPDDACAHCGDRPTAGIGSNDAGAKLKVCGACRGVRYCSLACQKAHWTHGGHKAACAAAVAAARGAAAPASAP
jgi:hypothetical protein